MVTQHTLLASLLVPVGSADHVRVVTVRNNEGVFLSFGLCLLLHFGFVVWPLVRHSLIAGQSVNVLYHDRKTTCGMRGDDDIIPEKV